MTIKHFLTLISIAALGSASATTLSPETALSRAVGSSAKFEASFAAETLSPRLLETIYDAQGAPTIYVYTYTGNDGFMLVSASDATPAVLGYSETGTYDTRGVNPAMSATLKMYSDEISAAKDLAPYTEVTTRAAELAPVAPLITTHWDQGSPYSNKCPQVGSRHCVTGCVATSMAQVMNYWQYPPKGQNSITYQPKSFATSLTLDFSELEFDWDNMRDSYPRGQYSDEEANAVATLMKACGYSVKMDYTTSESGAMSSDVPSALMNYFGYDRGISIFTRNSYTTNDSWNKMIHDNLVNIGPVMLSGQSQTGGHSFVCDGYDGNGYFHINWGWGGLSDGYFLLHELTPSEIGTGGHYGGYNLFQEAIVGIMPPVGRLIVNGIAIDNCADDSGNVSGKGYIYRINDFNNIRVALTLRIVGGHITSPLYVDVYETDYATLKNGDKVLETTLSNNLNASDGDVEIAGSVKMKNYDVAKFYTLYVSYDLKGKRETIGSVRLAASSGVDGIADSASLSIVYETGKVSAAGEGSISLTLYDAAGKVCAMAEGVNPSIATTGLASGLYIASAAGADGVSSTKKLLLK